MPKDGQYPAPLTLPSSLAGMPVGLAAGILHVSPPCEAFTPAARRKKMPGGAG